MDITKVIKPLLDKKATNAYKLISDLSGLSESDVYIKVLNKAYNSLLEMNGQNTKQPFSEERECKYCGKKFTAKHPKTKYCSKKCAQENSQRYKEESKCIMCGGMFRPYKSSNKKFCSKSCQGAYARKNYEKKRFEKAQQKLAEQAKKRDKENRMKVDSVNNDKPKTTRTFKFFR